MSENKKEKLDVTIKFELEVEKKHSVRYKEMPKILKQDKLGSIVEPEVLRNIYVSKQYLPDPYPKALIVNIKEA